MAQMYPPVYPHKLDPDNPEMAVFESLRKLSDDHHVFYSKRLKGVKNAKEEVEIDFLVFDGKRTLLCFEVKGGIISYDGQTQGWRMNGNPMKTAPNVQASRATHSLIKYMGQRVQSLSVDWALWFPQCSKPKGLRIPELDSQLVFDEGDLLDVKGAIGRAQDAVAKKFPRRGASPRQAEDLVAELSRSLAFINKVGVRIARDCQQLVEVTSEQLTALDDLELNPRMVISGFAGTGKTLLAQEFARRLADRGKNVVFLCYNKILAKKIRYGFPRESSVQVATFHSLARRLIEQHIPGWWEQHVGQASGFWDEEVPLALLEIEPDALERVDAVIVDEGQDFKPEWFEFLENLLVDQEKSHHCVFLDEKQDIFSHWDNIPWIKQAAKKALRRNCRNTKAIIEYLRELLPSDMEAFDRSPEGLQVVRRKVSSPAEEKRLVVKDLRDLLQNQGVLPGEIVLLSNASRAESCLQGIDPVAGVPLVSMSDRYDSRKKSIQHTTIRMFKGLEAPVVFIVDLSHADPERLAQALYTSASRAQTLLYIYE
jgi:hypothetical protein